MRKGLIGGEKKCPCCFDDMDERVGDRGAAVPRAHGAEVAEVAGGVERALEAACGQKADGQMGGALQRTFLIEAISTSGVEYRGLAEPLFSEALEQMKTDPWGALRDYTIGTIKVYMEDFRRVGWEGQESRKVGAARSVRAERLFVRYIQRNWYKVERLAKRQLQFFTSAEGSGVDRRVFDKTAPYYMTAGSIIAGTVRYISRVPDMYYGVGKKALNLGSSVIPFVGLALQIADITWRSAVSRFESVTNWLMPTLAYNIGNLIKMGGSEAQLLGDETGGLADSPPQEGTGEVEIGDVEAKALSLFTTGELESRLKKKSKLDHLRRWPDRKGRRRPVEKKTLDRAQFALEILEDMIPDSDSSRDLMEIMEAAGDTEVTDWLDPGGLAPHARPPKGELPAR